MLRELRLNNLAIIKKVDLEFNNGLIALTGETGAGKSILLDGISLLIGERSSIDMIRAGANNLFAEGVFSLTQDQIVKLSKLGFEIEDEELIISRYLDKDLKSKITVNGMRITVSKLKELMSNVLDLVGQHEHQYLLNKNYHLELLDKFLDKETLELKQSIKVIITELKKINQQVESIEGEKFAIEEKKDIYEFQINEIDALNIKNNEDSELEEEYKILFNAGKIAEKLGDSTQKLKGTEISILKQLQKVKKNLEQLSTFSDNYSEVFTLIDKLYYELDEVSYTIEDMLEEVEIDDSRLEKVIKRIDAINKLKFKYGSTIVEIMTYRDEIQKKLSMIDFENDELDKLREKKKNLTKEYFEKSNLLSELRKKAGNMLEEKINEELKDLNMTAAQFKVEFTSREIIRNKGIDEVEFMMSTNVGEDIKPLAKIASGGEISRIMLALKTIFSEVDNISLLIFDEIDTGIAGETVKRVANKLKKLSERVQVVCVTHSQQIAAKATQQFYIKKEIENDLTETKVRELNLDERMREIARMISGDTITETSIKHAKEIMEIE
ncbi:MAG: DNA repair protein RecN [Leptotrichiaceae bacterium]|jgi:DNA repair protein RecN (Recombination protein N)|nr:DNA repair protein RecN [Leptotrichiaceae bacterium]MBP7025752.1 DNA repair protein RecN [Leptotrichiaceae bacterium]MBP8637227.1 DNA repair protein RecN [Leptotrichiaceae bacterium]MBP9539084.1 DNA repair protein RecN [Leptotrichiaceae bacterium]MBP9876555.1 DNA repair protein RecN [Leptotrichiaceae bacterium]